MFQFRRFPTYAYLIQRRLTEYCSAFQFRRFPTYAYLIQRRLTEYCSAGFPHSVICGSKLMCSSPQLIAACHDLHRLLMPRHSPCALISLTFVGADFASLAFSLWRKLAHFIAPPPQFEPASLGFKLVPAGSHKNYAGLSLVSL